MDMNEEYGLTPYETREILFYKTDNGEVRVEILLYQENLWLTQAKMAELFEVQKAAITKHLKNIFTSGGLQEEAVFQNETAAARTTSGTIQAITIWMPLLLSDTVLILKRLRCSAFGPSVLRLLKTCDGRAFQGKL